MANIGNLYADLTTSSASFQKDMGKAANAVRSNTANMNRNLARLERSFYNIQRSVKRTVKGMFSFRTMIGTVAGSAGLGLLIKNSLEFADTIGKTADRIGVTTDALQQYRHAAKLAGVDQSTLDKGFEAFTKRLGEARAGTGALVTYLRKYDETLLDTVLSSNSTEDALQTIFKTMDKMTSASDRAALSAAAFSRTAGVQMANLVREGTDSLNAMLREAKELGLVMDESLIREAEKANDAVAKLSGVLKTQMMVTLAELAPTITEVADGMVDWVKANRKLIDQKVDQTIQSIASGLQGIVDVYNNLPEGTGGAAGYGLIGGALFGKKVGATIAALKLIAPYFDKLPQGVKDWSTMLGGGIPESAFQKQSTPFVRKSMPPYPLDEKSGQRIKLTVTKIRREVDDMWQNWAKGEKVMEKTWKQSAYGFNQLQDELKEQNEKTVSDNTEVYNNFLQSIQTETSSVFYDMFSGQLDSFQSFADRMKDYWIRTMADMASKAVTQKLFNAGSTGAGTGTNMGWLGTLGAYGMAAYGGFSLGQMIGSWLGLGKEDDPRYKFGKGWQATAAYTDNQYKAISTITHHGKGEDITNAIRDLYEGYVDQANMLANVVGPQGTIAFKPEDYNFKFKNAERELTNLAEFWSDTLWSAFDDAFERMGFSSMEAVIKGISQEQDALGNAFQAALSTGSWMNFKSSLAEQIYNTITTDLTQALIQSQAIQGALMPIYGGISKGMTAASAGGGFDVGIFGQYATGALSQFNTLLAPIKPAFDAMASFSQQIKDMLVGSFQHGGVVPETGLAMVHKGENISPAGGTVIINADVITTNDVDTWLSERIQRIDTLRIGKKLSKVELSTAGLDI